MFIVLEGVDGAGKTTLAYELEARIRALNPGDEVLRYHHGPPTKHPLEEYELDYDWYEPDATKHVIVDRLHWGETIYGPIFREHSRLNWPMSDHIDRWLWSRGAIVVLLQPPLEVVTRRFTERGDQMVKVEQLRDIMHLYTWLASESVVPNLVIQEERSLARDVTEVVSVARLHEMNAAMKTKPFPTYIGPTRPEFLLLGEKRNDPRFKSCFVPYPSTSGSYLFNTLANVPALRVRSGIANALEEPITELWESLGKPRVVTLGKQAQRRANHDGLPHGAVPHPQYVRRFLHRRQKEYADLIVEAAGTGKDLSTWKG